LLNNLTNLSTALFCLISSKRFWIKFRVTTYLIGLSFLPSPVLRTSSPKER
jgi:hypothetical protein